MQLIKALTEIPAYAAVDHIVGLTIRAEQTASALSGDSQNTGRFQVITMLTNGSMILEVFEDRDAAEKGLEEWAARIKNERGR